MLASSSVACSKTVKLAQWSMEMPGPEMSAVATGSTVTGRRAKPNQEKVRNCCNHTRTRYLMEKAAVGSHPQMTGHKVVMSVVVK